MKLFIYIVLSFIVFIAIQSIYVLDDIYNLWWLVAIVVLFIVIREFKKPDDR